MSYQTITAQESKPLENSLCVYSKSLLPLLPSSTFPSSGFRASIGTLDSAAGHLPKDGPVLIVTASYEGQPADNAAHFVNWLENVQDAEAFAGIKFGVFGCGNRDWVNTYQRVPRLVDDALTAHGAIRLVERGEGDASGSEFFQSFDAWEKAVWEKLGKVSIVFDLWVISRGNLGC